MAAAKDAAAAWSPSLVGEPGPDEVAFGPQHRGQVPGRIGVEQGEQLAGGGGVAQLVGGAGGQRPRPAQAFVAYPEGVGVGEDAAGVAQRGLRLAAGGGGEGLHDADRWPGPGDLRWPAGLAVPPAWSRRCRRRRAAPPASRGRQTRYSMSASPSESSAWVSSCSAASQSPSSSSAWTRFAIAIGQGVPVTGPAQVPGGGAGGLHRGCGIGDRQRVRQVEQHRSQARVVAGLRRRAGQLRGGRRPLRARRPAVNEVDPAGQEQVDELVGADVEGLAEDERLGGEPVRVGRAGEHLQRRELLQGAHRVGVGIGAQHVQGGGELLARLGEAAPHAQRPPGDDLGAGRRAGLAALQVIVAGTARVLDRRGVVGAGDGGFCGAFPQLRRQSGSPVLARVRVGELGGGGVAGGGAGRGRRCARRVRRPGSARRWPGRGSGRCRGRRGRR